MRFALGVGALALSALVGASCSSITPAKVAVGDQCYYCRRTIQEPRLAAEMIDAGHLAYKFRSPRCLAKYLNDHPDETATLFVTDFGSGRMGRPEQAGFVPVVVDPNTNEQAYRAYLRKADAEAAARELKTTALDWQAVLAKERG